MTQKQLHHQKVHPTPVRANEGYISGTPCPAGRRLQGSLSSQYNSLACSLLSYLSELPEPFRFC